MEWSPPQPPLPSLYFLFGVLSVCVCFRGWECHTWTPNDVTSCLSTKIEKEKKEHARQHGMIRTEISGAEIAEEMEKERRFFQLQMCEVGKERGGGQAWVARLGHVHSSSGGFSDIVKFCLAVSSQSERDQDQERGGPTPESHQIFPRTVQVSPAVSESVHLTKCSLRGENG